MINNIVDDNFLLKNQYKQLHENIILIENFVDDTTINKFFQFINNATEEDWDIVYKKLLIKECLENFNRDDYENCINEGLVDSKEYFKGKTLLIQNDQFIKFLCSKIQNILKDQTLIADAFSTIHRLKNGWNMDAHIDDGNSISNMIYSSVIYPNDNYIGGEINFVNLGIKIKPIAKSIILFPSNLEHCVEPVIGNNIRYSCPGFIFKNSVRT